MSEQPEQRGGPPAPTEEHVEGHDVFVTRDESGVTSVSEVEEGADPAVVTDEDVGDDEGPDAP
jgi:hypothetical protein